jgi:hypothetical protein
MTQTDLWPLERISTIARRMRFSDTRHLLVTWKNGVGFWGGLGSNGAPMGGREGK